MTSESITGLILTIMFLGYLILETISSFRKHTSINPIVFILMAIGVFIGILFIYRGKELSASDLAQIILTIGLLTITAVYAWSTEKMAKETKKQAEASIKMAEEMREQRYNEALPILIPDVTRRHFLGIDDKIKPNELDYGILQTGVKLEVTWRNLGKGAAINSQFSFWTVPLDSSPDKVLYFPPYESSFLEIGGHKTIVISDTWENKTLDLSKAPKPQVIAEYNDIYERKITTVQEFRIENENGIKRPFLGELYFKIDGKRLGKEIINHD